MTEITILNNNKYFTNESIADIYCQLKEDKIAVIELTDGSIMILDTSTPIILK